MTGITLSSSRYSVVSKPEKTVCSDRAMSWLVTPARRARASSMRTRSFFERAPQLSLMPRVPASSASFCLVRSTRSKTTSGSRPEIRTSTGLAAGGPSGSGSILALSPGKSAQNSRSRAMATSTSARVVVLIRMKAYSGLGGSGLAERMNRGAPSPMNEAQLSTPSSPAAAASGATRSSVSRKASTSRTTASVAASGEPVGSRSSACRVARSLGGKKITGTMPNSRRAAKKTSPTSTRLIAGWRRASSSHWR